MEILNSVDMHFLLSLTIILVIFAVFYAMAAKKQKYAMTKIDESLKRQEQANYQLNQILNEIRRSNRLLGELADIESSGDFIDPIEQNQAPQTSAHTNTAPQVDSQHKLYVGNIDYAATEAELASYFGEFGDIEFVNIPVNRYTGKARGFGFVSFISKEDAERAMTLHGSEFKGRQIQVNFAKERGETA
jgi:RNA recognition motif-containing protein